MSDKIVENNDRNIKLEKKEKNLPWPELGINRCEITGRRRRQLIFV
jgi:hypothetical protein